MLQFLFRASRNIPNNRKCAKLFQNIPNYKKLSKPKFPVQRLSKYPKFEGFGIFLSKLAALVVTCHSRLARPLSCLEAKLFQFGGQTTPFGGQTSIFPNFRQFCITYFPKIDVILDFFEKNYLFEKCAHIHFCV